MNDTREIASEHAPGEGRRRRTPQLGRAVHAIDDAGCDRRSPRHDQYGLAGAQQPEAADRIVAEAAQREPHRLVEVLAQSAMFSTLPQERPQEIERRLTPAASLALLVEARS